MNDTQETVIEEYEQGYRVVREERNYPDLYHFEGPKGRVKSFENPHEARLYADMYVITGGFNEKQTGDRGIPPAIVSASEEIRMTYLAVQMSLPYAARAFAVQESVVRDAVDCTHARADKERIPTDEDA